MEKPAAFEPVKKDDRYSAQEKTQLRINRLADNTTLEYLFLGHSYVDRMNWHRETCDEAYRVFESRGLRLATDDVPSGTVLAAGVGGERLGNLLHRIGEDWLPALAKKCRVNRIVVIIGTNDAACGQTNKFQGSYQAIYDRLAALFPAARIFFVGVTERDGLSKGVEALNKVISYVCAHSKTAEFIPAMPVKLCDLELDRVHLRPKTYVPYLRHILDASL